MEVRKRKSFRFPVSEYENIAGLSPGRVFKIFGSCLTVVPVAKQIFALPESFFGHTAIPSREGRP